MAFPMSRSSLLVVLAALAATGVPLAQAGAVFGQYVLGAGEVVRSCPTNGVDLSAVCLDAKTTNVGAFTISLSDASGLQVGAFYEVWTGPTPQAAKVTQGSFCGSQLVAWTGIVNPPFVKVFPVAGLQKGSQCEAPATSGMAYVTW